MMGTLALAATARGGALTISNWIAEAKVLVSCPRYLRLHFNRDSYFVNSCIQGAN